MKLFIILRPKPTMDTCYTTTTGIDYVVLTLTRIMTSVVTRQAPAPGAEEYPREKTKILPGTDMPKKTNTNLSSTNLKCFAPQNIPLYDARVPAGATYPYQTYLVHTWYVRTHDTYVHVRTTSQVRYTKVAGVASMPLNGIRFWN